MGDSIIVSNTILKMDSILFLSKIEFFRLTENYALYFLNILGKSRLLRHKRLLGERTSAHMIPV